MAKKNVEIIVHEFVKALKTHNIRVDKAVLFGSYAKNSANSDSDIDIAIISPDLGKNFVKEAVFLKKISQDIDLDISPRPYSAEEYKKADHGLFLFDEIICKGKIID